ncbi:hypothetical protein ACFQX8_12145 [Klenkia terrae]|uniref:hypothetical protein n=1 Tax=Klenkia terrae TaxID=1052259 RepID=UPI003605F6B4
MNDPREVTVADVHKAGRPAGRLTRDGDDVVFGYLPDHDGPAVASTLPLGVDETRATAGAVPRSSPGCSPRGTPAGAHHRRPDLHR